MERQIQEKWNTWREKVCGDQDLLNELEAIKDNKNVIYDCFIKSWSLEQVAFAALLEWAQTE